MPGSVSMLAPPRGKRSEAARRWEQLTWRRELRLGGEALARCGAGGGGGGVMGEQVG